MTNLAAAVEGMKFIDRILLVDSNFSNEYIGEACLRWYREHAETILAGLGMGAGDADHPENDATDFAHPAWWRGHTYSVVAMCREVTKILDGEWSESAACSEPWETLRQRLHVLVTRPPVAGLAELTDEQWYEVFQELRKALGEWSSGKVDDDFAFDTLHRHMAKAAREFLGKV